MRVRLRKVSVAGFLVLALIATVDFAQAGPLRWKVGSPTSSGPVFPAASSILIDAGNAVPPSPGLDPLPGAYIKTHSTEIQLTGFSTTLPFESVTLSAADNGVISGSQVNLDLAGTTVPTNWTPAPVTVNMQLEFRPYVSGSIAGILLPALTPSVVFDDNSFTVSYGLDLSSYVTPFSPPIQQHSIAGTTVPLNWRIVDVRAIIGSLNLSIDLEPLSTDPVSEQEFALLNMTLTGFDAAGPASVPEPGSTVLLLSALGIAAIRQRRRRAQSAD